MSFALLFSLYLILVTLRAHSDTLVVVLIGKGHLALGLELPTEVV